MHWMWFFSNVALFLNGFQSNSKTVVLKVCEFSLFLHKYGITQALKVRKANSRMQNQKHWSTKCLYSNADIILILSLIKGSAEKKLENMCDYNYGKERYGIKEIRKNKRKNPPPISCHLQEIQQLVRERRNFCRLWRKATAEEKGAWEQEERKRKQEQISTKTHTSFWETTLPVRKGESPRQQKKKWKNTWKELTQIIREKQQSVCLLTYHHF